MEKRQRLLTTKAMISPEHQEPRAEMGVAGIQSLGEEALLPELGAALCSSEGSQRAGLREGSHLAGALEPGGWTQKSSGAGTSEDSQEGLWGAGKRRTLTQLPRLACGVAVVEVLTKTASSREEQALPVPHLLVSPTVPSQQDSDYREERVGRLLA